MKQILTVSQMRESDKNTIESGVSSVTLMGKAAEAVFDKSKSLIKGRTAIVCGKGNNGGDGYAIALLLRKEALPVSVIALDYYVSQDSLSYRNECKKLGIDILDEAELDNLSAYGTIYDCIFGTGFKETAQGVYAKAIECINNSKCYVISVDINSGLDGNNGTGPAFVRSDLTISIQNFQPGHFLNVAKDAMKVLDFCDIGIKPVNSSIYLLESSDVADILKPRKNNSSKADYGYITLIGGCRAYSGAAKLAAMSNAAARSGSGVVQLAVPRCITDAVMPYILETTLFPLSDNGDSIVFNEEEFDLLISKFRTIGFGMGIGNSSETMKAVQYILKHYKGTLLLDADGLNALAAIGCSILDNAQCRTVLTPHLREFSRLTGLTDSEINDNPVENAVDFARKHNVTLLLKGPSTIVTDGNITYIVDKGCPGMATAGSGDVLSGVLTALLGYSQEKTAFTVACGAFITGLAGQIAQEEKTDISMVASDTARAIPQAVMQIRKTNMEKLP